MKFILGLMGFSLSPFQVVDSVRFELAWGWAALVLLLLLFVPLVLWFYRLEDKPCPPQLSRGLTGLRVAFLIGVLALLAGPRFTVTGMVPQKNKIAVLVDSSRSMSIKEDGLTRLERARDVLGKGRFLEKLEKQTGVMPSVFSFSGQVSPLSREEIASFAITPEGNQTNISRAITEVSGNLGMGNILGIILLTDGAHNHGDNPLEALTGLHTPLYFIGTGKAGQAKDLSISLEKPPSIGYLNSKVHVRGEVRAFRVATESLMIEVKKDGKPFDSLKVVFPSGENRAPFNVQIPCDTEGNFTFTLSLPRVDGELTFDNNEAEFLLKVVKDQLKVLALSDQPTWDLSFLKSVVKSDPNAHFRGFVQVIENRWLQIEDFALKGSISTPNLSQEIDETDILILRGVPERVLSPLAEAIQKRVESGKLGIFLLPCSNGYAALGYLGSKMAELFPVSLQGETWRGNPCNMVLPVRDSPLAFLRLLDDPMENQEFYRSLPKFDGLFTYPTIKAGAEVLLSSTMEGSGAAVPSLLSHRVGRGNVAMLLGGPLWPMGFKLIPTGKGIKPYTAFTLNLLKWLANRREDAQVVLEIPAARGFVGQPSVFRVWVSDTRRQPIDSAQVTGSAYSGDVEAGRLTFVSTPEKGCYETTFIPAKRGRLDIQVSAHLQGSLLGEAKGQLLVELPTAEFDDPEVKIDLMTQLATNSGGIFVPAERFEDLLNQIKPTPGQKRESKILDVRDNGWVLALLLFLPLLEWWIRRWKGYS